MAKLVSLQCFEVFLLLMLLATASQSREYTDKPQIRPNVSRCRVGVGESVTIECHSPEDVKLIPPEGTDMNTTDITFNKRPNQKNKYKYSYTFHNMTEENSGTYSCYSNVTGPVLGSFLYIVVASDRPDVMSCDMATLNSIDRVIARRESKERVKRLKLNKSPIPDNENTLCEIAPNFCKTRKKMAQAAQIPGLKLTRKERNHTAHCGVGVSLNVQYEAYPEPTFTWLDPKNNTIIVNDIENKFRLIESPPHIILKISKLHVNDIGIYTLRASNNYTTESVDFFVNVITRPIVSITQEKKYYVNGEVASPSCQVDANPIADIEMFFYSYPYYPSTNVTKMRMLGRIVMSEGKYQDIFKASVKVRTSGTFVCKACSELGCKETNSTIIMSGVKDGFGVVSPSDSEDFINDNITLKCVASIFEYTSPVQWQYKNNTRLHPSGRINIRSSKTDLEYEAILKISKVQKTDQDDYVCIGQKHDGTASTVEHELKVYDPEPPYFKETTLNGTEVEIDITAEGQKTVTFKCYTGGTPKPNVTWYKDDTVINPDARSQYVHKNHDQEMQVKFMSIYDSGKYLCRTHNRFGEMEAFLNISIKGDEASWQTWIIAVVLLVIGLCVLASFCYCKIHREKLTKKELKKVGLGHFERGAVESLNPHLTIEEQAEYLPYDMSLEFPRDQLKLGKHLGSGAFGIVRKGTAYGILRKGEMTTVAVKMVKRDTDPASIRALAGELKIMIHLGKHLNVVNLLGACTKNIIKRELLVIVEYCQFGNLQNHLLRHRDKFINQIDPQTGKIDQSISGSIDSSYTILENDNNDNAASGHCNDCQNDQSEYIDGNADPISTHGLVCWAFQVACGMEYLSGRKVLHGDLAARNLLLAENNIVKICDFGLSKSIYKDANYMKKTNTPLPVKWMAIESIRDGVFSTQSDIWSFGIVLWEFFTLGNTPYPGIPIEQHYERICDGHRMEKPEYATDDIYDIMTTCWKEVPNERPTFSELVINIGNLLQDPVKLHYTNLNAPFMDVNRMCFNEKNDLLKLMSSPDHSTLATPSSLNHTYINVPSELTIKSADSSDESGIVTPGSTSDQPKFVFSGVPNATDLDSDDEYETEQQSRKDFNRVKRREIQGNGEGSPNGDSGCWNDPNNMVEVDIKGDRNGYAAKANPVNATSPSLMAKIDNLLKYNRRKTGSTVIANPGYMYAERYVLNSEV